MSDIKHCFDSHLDSFCYSYQQAMKIFLIFCCIIVCSFGGTEAYTTFRVIRGNSSTSEIGTCVKPFFKLRPVNRYITYLSAGCTQLTRNITTLYLRCQVDYKKLGNYRKLMGSDFFEVCDRLKNKDNKFYQFVFEWIIPKDVLNHPCPFSGDQFKLVNLTYPPIKYGPWPGGFYRATLTLKDDIDYNIFSTTSVMEVKNRENNVEFK